MQKDQYDIIIVGGGASGIMAAGRVAEAWAENQKLSGDMVKAPKILILEKNKKLGEKLKITGGGRCNITNAEYDVRELLSHYGKASEFLHSSFAQFGVKETFSFFELRGLPLVIQARKRAFPKTEKAIDVYNVLEKYIKAGGVEVKTSSAVTNIIKNGRYIEAVECGSVRYEAKTFIFATGGASHKETGSTGDGFGWLRDLGHTVESPTPSIVPLAVEDAWPKRLAGISVADMKITFYTDGTRSFAKRGGLLFTHFGISGPLVLNSAREVADELKSGIVTATIDLFPDMEIGSLERMVIDTFDANKNKQLKNVLADIVPVGLAKGLSEYITEKMDVETQANSVTKEDRKTLVHLLKKLPLTISGLMGDDRAVVSDGGVTLTEIDTRTMKSKVVDNLYVTGDLLHINRPSGGYSLQLCWTTGWVAGVAAAQSLDNTL